MVVVKIFDIRSVLVVLHKSSSVVLFGKGFPCIVAVVGSVVVVGYVVNRNRRANCSILLRRRVDCCHYIDHSLLLRRKFRVEGTVFPCKRDQVERSLSLELDCHIGGHDTLD